MKVNLNALIEQAFPTLDLTDEKDVAALIAAIDRDPETVNTALRAVIEKVKQDAQAGRIELE